MGGMWQTIDFGTIVLIVLFVVPMVKNFIEKFIQSRSRQSAHMLRLDPQVFFACNWSSIDFSGVAFHRGHS